MWVMFYTNTFKTIRNLTTNAIFGGIKLTCARRRRNNILTLLPVPFRICFVNPNRKPIRLFYCEQIYTNMCTKTLPALADYRFMCIILMYNFVEERQSKQSIVSKLKCIYNGYLSIS